MKKLINKKNKSQEPATRGDLNSARRGITEDIASVRTELKKDITSVKTELKKDITNLQEDMLTVKTDIADLKEQNKQQTIILLQAMDKKDQELKEDIIREIDIKFAEIKDNHLELMTFFREHLPIQQKQTHNNSDTLRNHETRIVKVEDTVELIVG